MLLLSEDCPLKFRHYRSAKCRFWPIAAFAALQTNVRCWGRKRTWAESANSDLARSQLIFGNLRHQSIAEGFCGRGRREKHVPSWKAVKAALQSFDRTGLLGLVQDLYAVDRDNQAFLHARLGLGSDQLGPYKAIISRWICPDLMGKQSVSISKAKKAITDYRKAIGQPAGWPSCRSSIARRRSAWLNPVPLKMSATLLG